jgi:hypothetical protein
MQIKARGGGPNLIYIRSEEGAMPTETGFVIAATALVFIVFAAALG